LWKYEPPRVCCSAGLWVSCREGKISLKVPGCFVLGWGDAADLGMEPAVVVPVDAVQRLGHRSRASTDGAHRG